MTTPHLKLCSECPRNCWVFGATSAKSWCHWNSLYEKWRESLIRPFDSEFKKKCFILRISLGRSDQRAHRGTHATNCIYSDGFEPITATIKYQFFSTLCINNSVDGVGWVVGMNECVWSTIKYSIRIDTVDITKRHRWKSEIEFVRFAPIKSVITLSLGCPKLLAGVPTIFTVGQRCRHTYASTANTHFTVSLRSFRKRNDSDAIEIIVRGEQNARRKLTRTIVNGTQTHTGRMQLNLYGRRAWTTRVPMIKIAIEQSAYNFKWKIIEFERPLVESALLAGARARVNGSLIAAWHTSIIYYVLTY